MGGSSSAPEPPDYSGIAKASEKSADLAYKIATRQQDWAEKTYADNKATGDLVIQKALGALDRQEADSARARERYQSLFEPLEEQLAFDAQDYASPERQEHEAGKAEADVAAQFKSARDTAQQRLEAFGVDPSQTRQGALDLGTRVAEAAAQASAGNQARTQTENIGRQLRSEAINVGRGYPGQINQSDAAAQSSGNAAVNTGLATTASGAQTMGTGMGWTGLGNQALNTWGNTLNQGYSNQMAQYNANQQASSGWGSALGSIAGIGLSFLEEGGAIPSPDEEGRYMDPSMSPSGGEATDDIPAEIEGGKPAALNAGEFVFPKDVVGWLGEKGMQQIIIKARKEMANGESRPAIPEEGPPQQVIPADSVGAIP